MKVLIVEPDPSVRDGLSELLVASKLEVCTATSGNQAIKIFNAELPQVVLMALSLPLGCGRYVMNELAKLPKPPGVVVLTAEENPDLPAYKGPLAVLQKPADPIAIIQAVMKVSVQ